MRQSRERALRHRARGTRISADLRGWTRIARPTQDLRARLPRYGDLPRRRRRPDTQECE